MTSAVVSDGFDSASLSSPSDALLRRSPPEQYDWHVNTCVNSELT